MADSKNLVAKELAKCTKDELIALIRSRYLTLTVREVRFVRSKGMQRRADTLMKQGEAIMNANMGIENIKKYWKGDDIWKRGIALSDRASKLLDGGR